MERSTKRVGQRLSTGLTRSWMSSVRSRWASHSTAQPSRKNRTVAIASAMGPLTGPKLTKYCRISWPEA